MKNQNDSQGKIKELIRKRNAVMRATLVFMGVLSEKYKKHKKSYAKVLTESN